MPRSLCNLVQTKAAGQSAVEEQSFLLAVLISFVLHTSFVLYSTWWQVSDVSDVEENVGQLFRVEFRDLESENFISRPSQQQLQQERQIALREQIEQLSELPDMPAEDELASNTRISSGRRFRSLLL